jgi:hypothetical protein
MSYTTNINLIRNGLTKNWKQQDFPQKKMYYGYKSIFVIKLYFWLRLFLIYNKINLIQFSVNLLEDNFKSILIVINRSFFKNRGRKRHWLFPRFSKLNHAALLILYSNIPEKLKLVKRFNMSHRNIGNKIRRTVSYLYRQYRFIKFHIELLKRYIVFIKKKKLIILNNMMIFSKLISRKKNWFSNVSKSKEWNRMDIIRRRRNIGFKNFKYIHIKNIIAKKNQWIKKSLKKLKIQNKQKTVYLKKNILINIKKKKNYIKRNVKRGNKRVKKYIYFKKKKFKKIFRMNRICAWLGHTLFTIFNIYFIVKIRFEKLRLSRLKENEDSLETIIKHNPGLFKFSNNLYFTKLVLPKSEISNITEYSEFLWINNIQKFLNSYKFKRLENILIAAVKFRNIQILADLLAFKLIGQWNHKKIFLWISNQLNYILLNNLGGNLKTYRIGLYGRINNVPRARAMFFSSKNYSKPNRGTFSNQIYYAESRATAPIGAFHIRIWLEYII